jgi:antitoxin MazE
MSNLRRRILRQSPMSDIHLDIRGEDMDMFVGKWGNSLAMRFPRELVEKYQLAEGKPIPGEAIESMLREVLKLERQAIKEAAMEEIRKRAFSLPADWKFDRDEANWRPAMDKW